MKHASLLDTGLKFNAMLSLLVGLVLLFAPSQIADLLGFDIDRWLRGFGAILVVHAVALAWVAALQSPAPWARANLLVIVPYPAALLALAGSSLIRSTTGRLLLVADALLVGIAAVAQWVGLRNVRSAERSPAR